MLFLYQYGRAVTKEDLADFLEFLQDQKLEIMQKVKTNHSSNDYWEAIDWMKKYSLIDKFLETT